MKATVIDRYGAADVFRFAQVETPRIKRDQLLVQVYATSINPIDWKIRKGLLKLLIFSKFPLILGFDISGKVVEIGEQVTHFKPGEWVYAKLEHPPGGAYAEYAVVSEKAAAHKPADLSHEQAAAVPLAAMTALQALRDQGNLTAGQKVLINGASGGVGTFAVQIAKFLKAEVTGVCSSNNAELVKQLGADRVIDYAQQDFTHETEQYDIVFDVVGNRSLAECQKILRPHGVYITTQPLPANFLQSFLTRLKSEQQYKVALVQSSGEDLDYLRALLESNKIRSVIDRTYPLAEIAAAHAYCETERAVGKVVVTVTK